VHNISCQSYDFIALRCLFRELHLFVLPAVRHLLKLFRVGCETCSCAKETIFSPLTDSMPNFDPFFFETLISSGKIEPAYHSQCRDMFQQKIVRSQIMSQGDQDWMVFHNFFRGMKDPTKGVYLDIGANDAVSLSSTLFFDKCLGWKGVCVEPNPQYTAGFARHRSCRLIKNCVWTEKKEMNFDFFGTGGKISDIGVSTNCLTIRDILKENADILGSADDEGKFGTDINFVSLDVEGIEPHLLSCLDIAGTFSSAPEMQGKKLF
jgi:hypothetical protein